MRIFEIENINRAIIALKRLSEDYEAEFIELYNDLTLFKRLKGGRLNNFVDDKIIPFREKLKDFLSTQFYDDPDIDKIKARLQKMLELLEV
jgi:hypothetical protein